MRALVLSGGGSHGAFQAGVIHALATTQGHRWGIVAGVSVGALNGAQMAQHGAATQADGAIALKKMWLDVRGNESVFKGWPLSYLQGLWRGGFVNTAPLRKMIEANFKQDNLKTSGVKLRLGAVSFETGEYRYVTESTPNLVDWIMASSAFPAAFPPVKIEGQTWIDGGVRDTTPVRDVLAEPGVDAIDVVLTGPKNPKDKWDSKKGNNALMIGLRSAMLMSAEIYVGDLEIVKDDKRVTVYAAPDDLVMPGPLDFGPEAIKTMIAAGEKVGGL